MILRIPAEGQGRARHRRANIELSLVLRGGVYPAPVGRKAHPPAFHCAPTPEVAPRIRIPCGTRRWTGESTALSRLEARAGLRRAPSPGRLNGGSPASLRRPVYIDNATTPRGAGSQSTSELRRGRDRTDLGRLERKVLWEVVRGREPGEPLPQPAPGSARAPSRRGPPASPAQSSRTASHWPRSPSAAPSPWPGSARFLEHRVAVRSTTRRVQRPSGAGYD